jgi:hypothetical protein
MRRQLLFLLPLRVACSSATALESPSVRVLGAIAGYHSVRITTYGGGCHRAGEIEVEVQGLEAVITPYDYTAPPGSPCTRQLIMLEHEARVSFGQRGTARIIVVGIDHRQLSTTNTVGDTLRVERTLEIP